MAAPVIVGIGGTTRVGSTSETALRVALRHAERMGAETIAIAGTGMPVEPYDPQRPERSPQATTLIEALRRADAVVVASPGYHGSLSGLVKNTLDYVEDLREDARPYLDGRAFGVIAVAEGPQALGPTVAALRSIAHALRAWPTPYAAMINSTTRPFGPNGDDIAVDVDRALAVIASQTVEFARMRQVWSAAERTAS